MLLFVSLSWYVSVILELDGGTVWSLLGRLENQSGGVLTSDHVMVCFNLLL